MRSTMTAMALALSMGASAPALAQPDSLCPTSISNDARKPLVELQNAVNSRSRATIATAAAAARAAVKTNVDRCVLAQLELKAAVEARDSQAAAAAMNALLASGSVSSSVAAPLVVSVGKLAYVARDYDAAAASFARASQLAPTSGEPLVLLAETRAKKGRIDEALALFKRAAAVEAAAGRKVDEDWLKRGIAIGAEAKSPLVFALTRDWVAAYPTALNWRDALRVYAEQSGQPDAALIDVYRLARATHALAGEADYARYAKLAVAQGQRAEAAAVLEQGFAANLLSRSSASLKGLPTGTATKAGTSAEAHLGAGDFAKAAELYRAALAKPGADAELNNLRLGMALAQSGDKAGATAALQAVTGSRAEIARYWLTYVSLLP